MKNSNAFVTVALIVASVLSVSSASFGEILAENSGVAIGNVTDFNYPGNAMAVHFDVDPSTTLQIQNIQVLSRGGEEPDPFLDGTSVAIWVWDDNRNVLFTSGTFDLSGDDSDLAWRSFNIASHNITVQGSFYAGFQSLDSNFDFGYLHDSPEGADYGRSYIYSIGSDSWTNADEDYMIEVEVTSGSAPTPIPGDANGDNQVDGSDVTILAGNWQHGVGMADPDGTWAMGDFNNDGRVDGSDVTILAGNWQAGVTAAAASVPEPSSIVLLLSVGSFMLLVRRRLGRVNHKSCR